MSRVDLKKSPSSRIGQPREKQSDDLSDMWKKSNFKTNEDINNPIELKICH